MDSANQGKQKQSNRTRYIGLIEQHFLSRNVA